jgi:hypothetical protein
MAITCISLIYLPVVENIMFTDQQYRLAIRRDIPSLWVIGRSVESECGRPTHVQIDPAVERDTRIKQLTENSDMKLVVAKLFKTAYKIPYITVIKHLIVRGTSLGEEVRMDRVSEPPDTRIHAPRGVGFV